MTSAPRSALSRDSWVCRLASWAWLATIEMLTVSCSIAAAMLAEASLWACEFSAISAAVLLTPSVISVIRSEAA